MSEGGEAQRLVHAVYGALDLFSSSEAELLSWSKELKDNCPAEDLLPTYFSPDNQGVLARHLVEAGVLNGDGEVDPYALRGFQRVIELLPHFRGEETARKPAPRAQIALTVPPDVVLPREARHLQRSLVVRIGDALRSADRRVLLASPYWSVSGNEIILPLLERPIQLGLPVTLAGAREHDVEHHRAMLACAAAVAARGVEVEALTFQPPRPGSLFHAKIVAGKQGYLGSANLTASGLGTHVEVGVPLEEADVERVWWLIETLKKAELLTSTDT